MNYSKKIKEAIEIRIKQRRKLNEFYHKYKLDMYECALCDKKIPNKDIAWKSDGNSLYDSEVKMIFCVCKNCSPNCYYCGKCAVDKLIGSAFEDEETIECYGEIFLFCEDCAPSCKYGNCMGYYDSPCHCEGYKCSCYGKKSDVLDSSVKSEIKRIDLDKLQTSE